MDLYHGELNGNVTDDGHLSIQYIHVLRDLLLEHLTSRFGYAA